MTEASKAIQGLYTVEAVEGSYWLLKARVELSKFRKTIEETKE